MQPLRLWADFNEVDDGVIWTSLRRAHFVPEGEPVLGQWIEMFDHEGNICSGVVVKVDKPLVWLHLDFSTWIDADKILEPFGEPFYDYRLGTETRTATVGKAVA